MALSESTLAERAAKYGGDYYGRNRFSKFLPFLSAGSRVLDVGSHSGVLLNFLESRGFVAVGIERDPVHVEECRRLGFVVLEGDVFSILDSMGRSDTYDAVFLSDFVEHLGCHEVARLFRLLVSVLRRSGVLVILAPNSRNLTVALGGIWEDDLEHRRPYALSALRSELTRLGLSVIAAGPDPDSRERLWSWHPLRLARNIARAILARLLMGPDWSGTSAFLVARKEVQNAARR
jgi:SAM-dependent methyltransferase